ncbi:MAG: methyl-accepting chemotaxis protein [Lachnospiraceae bacterium]|nr:methyl-accepting chemotaxis protein [Lachnospiraceae bacterium]
MNLRKKQSGVQGTKKRKEELDTSKLKASETKAKKEKREKGLQKLVKRDKKIPQIPKGFKKTRDSKLPIETGVAKENKKSFKKLSIPAFRSLSKKKEKNNEKQESISLRDRFSRNKRQENFQQGEFKRVERVAWYRGIQVKLWSIVFIPILFLIILGIVSTSKASTGIMESYTSSLSKAIGLTADYYDFIFSTVRSNYNALLKENGLKGYVNGVMQKMGDEDSDKFYNDMYKQFQSDVSENKFLNNVYVLTDDDKSITTSGAEKDKILTDLCNTKQGAEAMEDEENTFYYYGTVPELDEGLNTSTEEYAVRMMRKVTGSGSEENGLKGGIIVLDLTRTQIESVIGKLNIGDGSISALITRDGQEIYGTDANIEEGKTNFVGQDFYTQAIEELNDEETMLQKNIKVGGKDYFFVMSKIGETKCSICYMVPQSVINEQASDIKMITIFLVIVSIIVAGFIGIIVAQGISKTISSFLKQINKVSKGDLTVKVYTKRKDEFAVLATGISDMIAHTKHLIQKVEVVSTELTHISKQVIESSEMFLKSSKGIENSVNEIEVGTNSQAKHSVNCLEEMDHLSKRIQNVSENTQKISDIATGTNQSIHSGMEIMEILNDKSQSTAEITNVVIEGIENLEKQSRSIGQIIGAINDIASETNLLSLNASIEAARAGAAGRGFSVVATEIRKLADQSMDSAKEIQNIVNEITNNTQYVVETAKQADNIVQEQQKAVKDTTEAFEIMQQQVRVLMNELESILAGVQEMEETRHATLTAIEEISAVSEETAASAEEVSNVVEKQLDVVEELSGNSEHLSTSADELSKAINQFIIR